MRGTPHRFSSGFLGGEGGIEWRAGSEHGAGDIEVPVGDGAEGSAMRMAALRSSAYFARLLGSCCTATRAQW